MGEPSSVPGEDREYTHSQASEGESEPFNAGVLSDQESVVSQSGPESDGKHWAWDGQHQDYVQWRGGKLLLYREYQKSGVHRSTARENSSQLDGDEASAHRPVHSPSNLDEDHQTVQDQNSAPSRVSPENGSPPPNTDQQLVYRSRPPQTTTPRPPPTHNFTSIDKPKRFFSPGRIFKTAWFEHLGNPASHRPSDLSYPQSCPPFHATKPLAKFRWFVVVRKRLHHSLCFAITTFGSRGGGGPKSGRARDYVVLYSAGIEPPEAFPEEEIERRPVAVIVEDGEQFISPCARLDCGRIYTVEDGLRVMKIGRVHPEFLGLLEEYYVESVS